MQEWDDVLSSLADDPADYDRQGGVVLLQRHGTEFMFTLKQVPGVGLAVEEGRAISGARPSLVPIGSYVQRELLGLPRLARQIVRALEKSAGTRPGRYIEGPARCQTDGIATSWTSASIELRAFLNSADPGTTSLVQLMAPAGQGKTVLLEQISLESARAYQPDSYPLPLLLSVDLLGRYVGNVDDAIAGSLNNTYVFPGLTQRDVLLCLRHRWLLLALDGFDELVARVGARDAFLRINELLEQLDGAGTIILSARESFFDLYQMTAAIRSYLQPRHGSYSASVVKLLPWKKEQGLAVFTGLGSTSPEDDLAGLLSVFEGDAGIVFHPFFLTRLADLWTKGERFVDAGHLEDRLARTKYVIDTFVGRESGEKWIDRDRNPLLDPQGHTTLLAGIAEEMWRSGAFRLSADELRVAAEIAIAPLSLAPSVLESVIERVPQHAAFVSRDRGFAFLHDRFFYYFLGQRLAELLAAADESSILALLSPRELGPSVVEWVVWNYKGRGGSPRDLVNFLNNLISRTTETVLRENLSRICAAILDNFDAGGPLLVPNYTFQGDSLCGLSLKNVQFVECRFWHIDMSSVSLLRCRFVKCSFSDLFLDQQSRFDDTLLEDCDIASVEVLGEPTVFKPDAISRLLARCGARVTGTAGVQAQPPIGPAVDPEFAQCTERFVKGSERTCDVAVEDLERAFGKVARLVAKVGVDSGVMREVIRGVSGPKKTFVRFRVDRNRLLKGQVQPTGEAAIDAFWAELARRRP